MVRPTLTMNEVSIEVYCWVGSTDEKLLRLFTQLLTRTNAKWLDPGRLQAFTGVTGHWKLALPRVLTYPRGHNTYS